MRELIRETQANEGVWFATAREVAQWFALQRTESIPEVSTIVESVTGWPFSH